MKGIQLKKLRNLSNLRQEDVAKMLEISVRTYIKLEKMEEISEKYSENMKSIFKKDLSLLNENSCEIDKLNEIIDKQKSELETCKKTIENLNYTIDLQKERLKKQDASPVLDVAAESRQPYQTKTKS